MTEPVQSRSAPEARTSLAVVRVHVRVHVRVVVVVVVRVVVVVNG
ncbi:hypothetical protein [Sorangium sp. So ce204]